MISPQKGDATDHFLETMSFKPKTYPTLGPNSQRLIDAYNFALGSALNPCNPGGLAEVLKILASEPDFPLDYAIKELES